MRYYVSNCNEMMILDTLIYFWICLTTGNHVETVVALRREKVNGYVNVDLDLNKIKNKNVDWWR